jgi:CRP-like cAMP-binding protein
MGKNVSPDLVRNLPLLAGMTEQDKETLLEGARLRHLMRGDRLAAQGKTITSFYIICSGVIQLSRATPDGRDVTPDVLIAGDTLGETEILNAVSTYKLNATAVKEAIVLEFPVAWLRKNALCHGLLAQNLLCVLAKRTHAMSILLEHKSLMSAPQQMACFLQLFCAHQNLDPHEFELPYTKTLLASRLGLELETISRGLAKLREHGITVTGTAVSFCDIDKAENYVCNSCSLSKNCREHELLRERLHNTSQK